MKNVACRLVALFVLILLWAAGTAHSEGVDMKDGEWEITSRSSMTTGGMTMPSPPHKSTHCLTRDEPVPVSDQQKDCRIVGRKVAGNKVSWRMECKNGEGEGEISYHGTTYDGFFKMKMVDGGETMTMDMTLAGRYLGPCPKGQRSGPTGATAAQMAKGQEMAAQAKQQQAQIQAEQAANAKQVEALIRQSVVPAEEPGACSQEGFARTPQCEGKAGDLNLKPGQYEITVERGSRVGTNYSPVKVERKTLCLTEDGPVPDVLGAGRPARVKRGSETITWTDTTAGQATKGGILYRGNSLEGAVTSTMDLAGQQSLSVTKVTGHRTGDGDCIRGRDYSAKRAAASPAKKDGENSPADQGDILKNPAKSIRNLLGF